MLDAPCGPLQFRASISEVVPNLLIKAKPRQDGPFRFKVVLQKELKCIEYTQQIILAIGGACCQLTYDNLIPLPHIRSPSLWPDHGGYFQSPSVTEGTGTTS
jgi:hypothetical protein